MVYESIEDVLNCFNKNLYLIEGSIVRILLSKYSAEDIELLLNPTVNGFSCKEFIVKSSGKAVARIEHKIVASEFDIVGLKSNYKQEIKHWIAPDLINVKEK